MNWLTKLKNFDNTGVGHPTETTKIHSVVSVGAVPSQFQKSEGANDGDGSRLQDTVHDHLGNNVLAKLALFRFDLMKEEIEAGRYSVEALNVLHRVNNMAWEFMQADGMAFEDAIRTASDIVAHTRAALCEAAYVDAIALFERLSRNAEKSSVR